MLYNLFVLLFVIIQLCFELLPEPAWPRLRAQAIHGPLLYKKRRLRTLLFHNHSGKERQTKMRFIL